MSVKPVICWDYDETLGYFRPLEFRYLGTPVPSEMPAPRLKPGIRELLGSLSEFTHVLTTAAIGEYAREVLREFQLLDFFSGVFGRENGIFSGEGKDYKVVGDRFGISEEDLRRWLVIVGNDSKRDPDIRFRQIVMVYDDRMADQPSKPIGVVLRRLLVEGEAEIKRGFDRLLERARQDNQFDPSLLLEEELKIGIDYWGSFADNKLHPMIILPRPALRRPTTGAREAGSTG